MTSIPVGKGFQPDSGETIFVTKGGNDSSDGTTDEKPVLTIGQGVINAGATGATNISVGDGNFDEVITVPDDTDLRGMGAGLVSSADGVTTVTAGNTSVIQVGFLGAQGDNSTAFVVNGKSRSQLSVNTMVLGTFGGPVSDNIIGIDILGTNDDIPITVLNGECRATNSTFVRVRGATDTPPKIDLGSITNFADGLCLVDHAPSDPNQITEVDVSFTNDTAAAATGIELFTGTSGTLTVIAEQLNAAGQTIATVGNGLRFGITSPAVAGNIIIQSGGICNLVGIGVWIGNITVESGGILNANIMALTGDIVVDAGGVLNCAITVHTGSVTRNGTINGQINDGGLTKFYGGFRVIKNPGDSVNIDVPAVVTGYTMTLPPAQGVLGQVQQLDASLELQWQSPTDMPGGSDTEVQFNNSGSFDGISGITTDGTDLFVSGRIDGDGIGGLLILRGKANSPTGGPVQIEGGGASNIGGKIQLIGGTGTNSGGNVELLGGEGPNAIGGSIIAIAGDAGTDDGSGAGGDVFLEAGAGGFNAGKGGDIVIVSGSAEGSGEDSGAITIDAGTSLDGKINDVLMQRATGRVGMGVSQVVDSAQLEVSSASRGFLMPRMTTAERDNISSPATGLEIYNITTNEPEYFNGSVWSGTAGNETLAETLVNGNTTGGTSLSVSSGDRIISPDGTSGVDFEIEAGSGSSGVGGHVRLRSGGGSTTGGALILEAGDGTSGGGALNLNSGNVSGAGIAGTVIVKPGISGGASTGGQVIIDGGVGGDANGTGGAVTITAGLGGNTNGDGGNLLLNSGAGAGTGDQGQVLIDGEVASKVGSTAVEIFNAAELESLATAGVITIANGETLTLNIMDSFTSATRFSVEGDGSLSIVGTTGSSDMTYSGTGTFISGSTGGLFIESVGLFSSSTGALAEVNGNLIIQNCNVVGWDDLGFVDNGFLIIRFTSIFDCDAGFEITNTGVNIVSALLAVPGMPGDFITVNTDIDSPSMTIQGSEVTVGGSFFKIDPSITGGTNISISGITMPSGDLFNTSGGATGTFAITNDESVALTTIDSVTDSGGVARFNFTVGPTLFVNQQVDMVNFVTETSYNQSGIITAVGAGFYEIASIAFTGDDATGDFSSDSVEMVEIGTALIDGNTLVIRTTAGTQYNGGATVYNQQTNSFRINRTFVIDRAGVWNTAGIDQTDPRVLANNNPGFIDSKYIATAFVNDNSTANGAIVNDTFTDMVFGTGGGGLIEGSTIERWQLINGIDGIFEYTGNEPFDGLITFDFTVTSSGGTVDFRFKWLVDEGGGFVDLPDLVEALAAVGSDAQSITKTFPLRCEKGCQIKPQITRNSGTSGITTSYATVFSTQ